MPTHEIRDMLYEMQDLKYREFQSRLIPSIDKETVIGVRTPALRGYAKELLKRSGTDDFLNDLPHLYFDENQLHAFILSEIKDYEECIARVEAFLPHVDNWATCDQLSPKVFRRHRAELLGRIKVWLKSEETYTIRFAVGMLMEHFLDEDFDPIYHKTVSALRSGEYYVNMMVAWYFATALAKRYEETLPFIRDRTLAEWTHNKAIQKALESYRITDGQKAYLRGLRIGKAP